RSKARERRADDRVRLLPWPRGRPLDVPRSHPTLLVDEELARAVRTESAAAVGYRWGVSATIVWRWRKALGVTYANNPGTARLVRAAAKAVAEQVRKAVRERREELGLPEPGQRG